MMRSIFLFGAVALLASCSNNQSENKTVSDQPAATAASASVQLKDDKLNAIYQHYIHLTTALTNGDTAEAKVAGLAIETGAKEVKGADALVSAANEIITAKELESQRKSYSALSNSFIALLKNSGLSSGELYVDYCPMALNDQGAYWLSNVKEIRNPYFGASMLSCGDIKETIQ